MSTAAKTTGVAAAATPGPQLSPQLLAAIESAAFMQCLVSSEAQVLNGSTPHEQFAKECMRTGAALALQMQAECAQANKKAIHSLLMRIQRTPQLAYHFDPLTQSFEDLTAAHTLNYGLPDLVQFRKEFASTLTFEAPGSKAGAE